GTVCVGRVHLGPLCTPGCQRNGASPLEARRFQRMYSVVLAAMLTTGGTAPAWHGCHGCHGCCGGRYGNPFSCHGWHGCFGGRSGCYGCCGGCYGCWGGGCSGCWGGGYSCAGCYGAGCNGACFGCTGCYGYGSSCFGCYGVAAGTTMATPYVMAKTTATATQG